MSLLAKGISGTNGSGSGGCFFCFFGADAVLACPRPRPRACPRPRPRPDPSGGSPVVPSVVSSVGTTGGTGGTGGGSPPRFAGVTLMSSPCAAARALSVFMSTTAGVAIDASAGVSAGVPARLPAGLPAGLSEGVAPTSSTEAASSSTSIVAGLRPLPTIDLPLWPCGGSSPSSQRLSNEACSRARCGVFKLASWGT